MPRVRLVDRLRHSSEPIVALIAPAGYGKTTLAYQWANADDRPTVWLTLGPDCDDPTILARYLVVAFSAACLIDDDLVRELDSVGPRVETVVASELARAVARAPSSFLLVLDDIHTLTDPTGVQLVCNVVSELPTDARLAMVGRQGGSFPFAEARARGDLLELGIDDLRFDAADAQRLLHAAGAEEMDADEIATIVEQSEGWAVGLYLAALARASRPSASPQAIRGDDRFVADYMRETMLSTLSPDDLDFLLRTSVLDELSGPLCDTALETTGSGKRLEKLEASNLLVVPLDHKRERYRYHHLLQDLLRAELEHRSPESVPVLTARASAWYERAGSAELAVRYAMAGEHVDLVASLMERYGQAAYYTGRASSFEAWLDWIDTRASIAEHPWLAALGTWYMLLEGHPAMAERWADAVASGEGCTHDAELEGVWFLIGAAMCRGGPVRMRDDATTGTSMLRPGSPWAAVGMVWTGMSELLLGNVDAAAEAFARSIELASEIGTLVAAPVAHTELAILDLHAGDVPAAAERIRIARDLIDAGQLHGYPCSALPLAVAGRIALHQGDPVRAKAYYEEAAPLRTRLTYVVPTVAVPVRLQLAWCAMGLGDADAARQFLSEADELTHHRPDLGSLLAELEGVKVGLTEVLRSMPGLPTLTPAEARLLPLLPTHLSFREIGERLFVSPHTVKTQAISIYRKLGVTSRGAAVETARRIGLLGP